jgi:hypothetical protein
MVCYQRPSRSQKPLSRLGCRLRDRQSSLEPDRCWLNSSSLSRNPRGVVRQSLRNPPATPVYLTRFRTTRNFPHRMWQVIVLLNISQGSVELMVTEGGLVPPQDDSSPDELPDDSQLPSVDVSGNCPRYSGAGVEPMVAEFGLLPQSESVSNISAADMSGNCPPQYFLGKRLN